MWDSFLENAKYFITDKKRHYKALYNRTVIKFKGGYDCACCGNKIPLKYTEIEGMVNNRRVAISVHMNAMYCKKCLLNKIESYFKMAKIYSKNNIGKTMSGIMKDKCDVFGNERYVIHGIMPYSNELAQKLDLDIRICLEWWNGFKISEQVFRTLLLMPSGRYKTSFIVHKNGKPYYCDANGVMIPTNGQI